MSSNQSIDIPESLGNVEMYKIIEEIRNAKSITSVLFDWTKCTFASTSALCLLLNLSYECEAKGIKFRHTAHENNLYFAQNLKPFLTFPAKSLELQESSIGAFLAAVDDESTIPSRSIAMMRYLRSQQVLSGLNINLLETLFGELYMNICQHSWAANGIAFIAINSQTNSLEMIVSDLGVGIPTNIKETFLKYENRKDSEAILFATQDLVTTQSTPQNYGRGLNNMKTSVASLSGNIKIFSGNGRLNIINGKEILEDTHQFHPGTQIQITLDFRRFESIPEIDYSEEVDF